MTKFKDCLCRIKMRIGYLLLFIVLLVAGSIFLLVGIIIGVFSAMWSGLERFWHKVRGWSAGKAKLPVGGAGKCRAGDRIIWKILVLAAVIGAVKVAVRIKNREK